MVSIFFKDKSLLYQKFNRLDYNKTTWIFILNLFAYSILVYGIEEIVSPENKLLTLNMYWKQVSDLPVPGYIDVKILPLSINVSKVRLLPNSWSTANCITNQSKRNVTDTHSHTHRKSRAASIHLFYGSVRRNAVTWTAVSNSKEIGPRPPTF